MKIHNHLCYIIVKYIFRNSKTNQLINLNESYKIFKIGLILLIYVLNDTNKTYGSKLTEKLGNCGYGGSIQHG